MLELHSKAQKKRAKPTPQAIRYETSIRPFVRFLNKQGNFDRLVAHCLEPETPTKEALFGILMLLYAQSPTKSVS